uniref:N-acetyltransferase domain-containing protein n=1 Tax=Cacopsylla melanoneura TaxID=428564 RepID=A0A8D8LP91_9HEMI
MIVLRSIGKTTAWRGLLLKGCSENAETHHQIPVVTSHCCCWKRSYTSRLKLETFARMNFQHYEPKDSGLPGILLQRTGPQHLAPIQRLLRGSFFQDEPMVTAFGLAGGATDGEFIDEEAKLVLEQLSVVAIDEASGDIVAAACNRTVVPEELITWPQEIDQIKCRPTQRLARFWYTMSTRPNIFTEFNVPSYFELTFLATTQAARGKGLALILARESLALALESRAPLAVIYCTHIASARIAQKLGMTLIASHKVNDVVTGSVLPSGNSQYSVHAIRLTDSKEMSSPDEPPENERSLAAI